MEIKIIDAANECGGFRPPKGHLDTQMYPECEGWPTDRNIVKKTVEKRKKKRKKKKASIDKESKMGWPISTHDATGIWQKWKNNEVDDKTFVDKMLELKEISGFPGLTNEPTTRQAVINILDTFDGTEDYASVAIYLDKWLSASEQLEDNPDMAEKVAERVATKFNLKQYRIAQEEQGNREQWWRDMEKQELLPPVSMDKVVSPESFTGYKMENMPTLEGWMTGIRHAPKLKKLVDLRIEKMKEFVRALRYDLDSLADELEKEINDIDRELHPYWEKYKEDQEAKAVESY